MPPTAPSTPPTSSTPPTARSAVSAPPGSPPTGPPDGRNQRRDRNRAAVVNALLAHYREGNVNPSADEIAERAGISVRSVFRYFDDREAMARAAIALQAEHLAPLWAVDATPATPFAERIDGFVAGRARLLEEMGEVGRLARMRATRQPVILAELTRIRAALRRQLTDLFAAELQARPEDDRAGVVAAADVLTSWEAHDLMRKDQGLTHDEVRTAVAAALRRLLDPGAGQQP